MRCRAMLVGRVGQAAAYWDVSASLARGVRTDISQRAESYPSAGRWVSVGALRGIPQLSPQAARSLARLGVQRPPSFACLPA